MTTFNEQPYDEQVRRLRAYAADALAHWGKTVRALDVASYENNAVLRADCTDGTYALRVYRPGKRPLAEIQGEWAWVGALAAVLGTVPRQAGDLYNGPLQGVDEPVHAATWHWIEGESVAPGGLTPDHIAAAGRCLAAIHNVPAPADPPVRPRLDYEGLFGERSPYNPKAGQQYISAESQETLDAVAARVREVMTVMDADADSFGLIHGDFIFKNTLYTPNGDAHALDFDDCGYGYYLYDLSCPLLFYKPQPAYADLKVALWDGYTSVRPLPERYRAHLEVLIAGRYVASCRWVAGNAQHPSLRGRAREIIDGRAGELRAFLATGQL